MAHIIRTLVWVPVVGRPNQMVVMRESAGTTAW
jgi:hypothetical protein